MIRRIKMEWLTVTNVLLLLIFIALCIVVIYLQYIFEAVERNEQNTRNGNNKLEEIKEESQLIRRHAYSLEGYARFWQGLQ